MTKEAAELIAAQSFDGLTVREKYSGRAMYGKETTGVVGSNRDFYEALGDAVLNNKDFGNRKILAEAIKSLRIDHMGLRMIYY